MTFDEIYLKHFSTITTYCYYRNGFNQYLAEEASSKAFDILYKKWHTLFQRRRIVLKSLPRKFVELFAKRVIYEAKNESQRELQKY